MKKENDYELFYVELPQAEYLNDINIQDEIDEDDTETKRGLTEDQVSAIAEDSRQEALKQSDNAQDQDVTLFSEGPSQSR
jgi:hypothetical protein